MAADPPELDKDVLVVLTPRQIMGLLALGDNPRVRRMIDQARPAGQAIHEALERLAPSVGQTYPKETQHGE